MHPRQKSWYWYASWDEYKGPAQRSSIPNANFQLEQPRTTSLDGLTVRFVAPAALQLDLTKVILSCKHDIF